jgi:DNA polymerase-3 subunit delta
VARPKASDDRTFDDLFASLEAGEVSPVHVLHGPETFLIERALTLFKKKAVEPGDDFAHQTFRGGETPARTIVSAARTVPMLSDRQLVIVRQADVLSKDDLDLMHTYIEAPVPSTCLVLVAGKIDKRFKLWSHASRNRMTYLAASLSERQLPGWISKRAQACGLKISPQAVQVLAESTGTDLATVEDALERLALYIGDRPAATVADVEVVVASSRVRSVFELTDALGRRDASAALRTLSNMLANQEAPLRLLATLATHVRRLLTAAELGRAVLSDPQKLAARLAIHPYAAEKVAAQAGRFSTRELRSALLRLARTDIELKSARRPDKLVMEEMILDLCLNVA